MSNTTETRYLNIVTDNEYINSLYDVSSALVKTLNKFCGPYASNVILRVRVGTGKVITDGYENVEEFTKDGIDIVRKLQPSVGLATAFNNLAVHIGKHVENACHDGTTTAMMAFSCIVEQIFHPKKRKQYGLNLSDCRDRILLANAVNEVLNEIEEYIDHITFTSESIQNSSECAPTDIRNGIVYHQSLLSSKGDNDLATNMVNLISKFPLDYYQYMNFEIANIERPQKYILIDNPYTFYYKAAYVEKEVVFQDAKQDTIEFDHIDILPIAAPFNSNNPELNRIFNFVLKDPKVKTEAFKNLQTLTHYSQQEQAAVEYIAQLDMEDGSEPLMQGRPLMLLRFVPDTTDCCRLYAPIIKAWNTVYPDTPIFSVCLAMTNTWGFAREALFVCADKITQQMAIKNDLPWDSSIIRDAGLKIHEYNVYLKNFFPKDMDENDNTHPSYTDPNRNPNYTKFKNELLETLENLHTEALRDSSNSARDRELIDIFRWITSKRYYALKIGGTLYDAAGNRSVARDVMGACMSVLKHGFVLSAYPKLAIWCDMKLRQNVTYDKYLRAAYCLFKDAFINTSDSIYKEKITSQFCLDKNVTNLFSPIQPIEKTDHHLSKESYLGVDTVNLTSPQWRWFTPEALCELVDYNVRLPIQPAIGYKETIKRLRAIVPQLINSTTHILVE